MSETAGEKQESWVPKVNFLKAVDANPESKITNLAKELGLSHSSAYRILEECMKVFVMSEDEPSFPRKLLRYYNDALPPEQDGLNPTDVEVLRPKLLDMAKRRDSETVNSAAKESTSRISDNMPSNIPDLGTDESLLRNILTKMKYVQPQIIDRFLQSYSMGKDNFDRNPDALLEYMKTMFTPSQQHDLSWL